MKTYIDKLVDAFVAWPLPESVCSDPCATMKGYPNRSGTNLLTAVEARQMFEYLLTKVQDPTLGLALALSKIEADAKDCEMQAAALKAKKDELNAYLMSTQAMAHRLDVQRIKIAIGAIDGEDKFKE